MSSGLFSPITINGVTIPNRIVKSAMAEGRCDADGAPRPELARLYGRWAKGGVGLAITGMAHIRPGYSFTGGEIGLYHDRFVAPLRQLTRAVHEHGGRVFAQICHAPPQIPRASAKRLGAVATSSGFAWTNMLFHRALSSAELASIAVDFGLAAKRARDAGFDGVQLHGAHGYLISRSLSPRHNRRRDAWGGDFERRLTLLHRIYQAIRAEVGRDYPLIIKLNAHDGERKGLQLNDSVRIGVRLERWGFDAIEVSAGTADVGIGFYPSRGGVPFDLSRKFLGQEFPFLRPVLPLLKPILDRAARQVALREEAYFLPEALAFARALTIPVISVGGIRSLKTARHIVESTPVAMVALARPLIREPLLPNGWREGRSTATSCTSCNRCFVALGLGERLKCRKLNN